MKTKDQYFTELEGCLRDLPQVEREELMEYHREYADEAGLEDYDQMAGHFGTPRELADRCIRSWMPAGRKPPPPRRTASMMLCSSCWIRCFPGRAVAADRRHPMLPMRRNRCCPLSTMWRSGREAPTSGLRRAKNLPCGISCPAERCHSGWK